MSDVRISKLASVASLLVKYAGSGIFAETEALADESDPGHISPDELVADLEELGPTFVKLGQLLSTRADLLRPPYLEALQKLQDDVGPFGFDEARAAVEDELGTALERAFESFEERPVASGSLAQVHRARLRDGTEVAVKVQRPGIRQRVREDLAALEKFAALAARTSSGSAYRPDELIDQFRRSIAAELDFTREAHALRELGSILEDFDLLVVPTPVADYTTSRVLTMTYIRGRSIVSVGPLGQMEIPGSEMADQLVHAYLRQAFVEGFVHADPHPGNVLVTDDGKLALIDLGMTVHVEPAARKTLLSLVLAAVSGRSGKVADLLQQLGTPGDSFAPAEFEQAVARIVGDYLHAPSHRKQAGALMLQIVREAGRHGLQPPLQLTMLGRTLLSLDWVSDRLDPDLEVDQVVERHAMELMQRHTLTSLSPGNLFATMLDAGELIQELPTRLDRITETLAGGSFRVKVDAVDEESWQHTLHNAANRITFGVVVAALIIGSALLGRVETGVTILGYSALPAIFFLAGALAGLALIVGILRDKLRE